MPKNPKFVFPALLLFVCDVTFAMDFYFLLGKKGCKESYIFHKSFLKKVEGERRQFARNVTEATVVNLDALVLDEGEGYSPRLHLHISEPERAG